MASMNKVILLGNLGQDPEIRRLQDGTALATLSIATSESWMDKSTGERRERTQWHRVVVWPDGLVKVCEKHLAKGDQVMIVGQLEHRKWEDKDGQTRYATEVVMRPFKSELQITRCKAWEKSAKQGGQSSSDDFGSGAGSSGGSPSAQRRAATKPDIDDEIPF